MGAAERTTGTALLRQLAPHLADRRARAIGRAAAAARMWTIDGHRPSSEVAGEVFARVGVDVDRVVGGFDKVLAAVLTDAAPVDLLHVDGHHQEQATLHYLDVALPYLSDDAVVLFDDIRWPAEDGVSRPAVRRRRRGRRRSRPRCDA